MYVGGQSTLETDLHFSESLSFLFRVASYFFSSCNFFFYIAGQRSYKNPAASRFRLLFQSRVQTGIIRISERSEPLIANMSQRQAAEF
jgi:hypothetical protein